MFRNGPLPAQNPFWRPALGIKGGVPAGGGGAGIVGNSSLVAFDPVTPFVYPVYDPMFTYPVVEAPVVSPAAPAYGSIVPAVVVIGALAALGYFLTR